MARLGIAVLSGSEIWRNQGFLLRKGVLLFVTLTSGTSLQKKLSELSYGANGVLSFVTPTLGNVKCFCCTRQFRPTLYELLKLRFLPYALAQKLCKHVVPPLVEDAVNALGSILSLCARLFQLHWLRWWAWQWAAHCMPRRALGCFGFK